MGGSPSGQLAGMLTGQRARQRPLFSNGQTRGRRSSAARINA
jgi:hypothetical protein